MLFIGLNYGIVGMVPKCTNTAHKKANVPVLKKTFLSSIGGIYSLKSFTGLFINFSEMSQSGTFCLNL